MISQLTVRGYYAENTYFYIDPISNAGFLIDPGAQAGLIAEAISSNRWKIEKILLTHGHFDHFGAAGQLAELLGAPIYISPADARYLEDPRLNLSATTGRPIRIEHYEYLSNGEILRLRENSEFQLKTIFTPGHTPGSVTFYSAAEKAAFVGDTFYEHSPGLTNFPGGDEAELNRSVSRLLRELPADTLLLSGHSSPITVAEERQLLFIND